MQLTKITVKEYTALISQTGETEPIATVLHNTFGSDIVWTRSSKGLYYATLHGAFPADKTFVIITATINNTNILARRATGDSIEILSYNDFLTLSLSDGKLLNNCLRIQVYNI